MDTNTPTLTEQEKKYLENYKEENPFLKSLSDFYKERAMLSEKQILALRKESDNHKKKTFSLYHNRTYVKRNM
jgi:hypothetical protein